MIEGVPLVGITAPAVLLLVVVLILRGLLIPRRTYDDIIRDRDEWRAAHQISEQARSAQDKQISELLEHARTTHAFISAIPVAAARAALLRHELSTGGEESQ